MRILEIEHIDSCEDALSHMLFHTVLEKGVPRVFLGFPSSKGHLDARVNLKTERDWNIGISDWSEGIIGETLRTGEPQKWIEGGELECSVPFKRVASETVESYCYPIGREEDVCAILLFDIFRNEEIDVPNFHVSAQQLVEECGKILNSPDTEAAKLVGRIRNLTEFCRKDTQSTRGYTAVRHVCRSPELISTGKQVSVFRELGFNEGLTGEVYRTGRPIILGDVWEHPKYFSSDHSIKSEVVWPLDSANFCTGVLNMESTAGQHYTEARVATIKSYAVRISEVVDELLRLETTNHSGSVRAVSYITSAALGSGSYRPSFASVYEEKEALLQKLKIAIEMIDLGDAQIRILNDINVQEERIKIASDFSVIRTTRDGRAIAYLPVPGRGRLFCLVEISSIRTIKQKSEELIDFLGRFVSSEFQRRQHEASLARLPALVSSLLEQDVSFEEFVSGRLDDICSYLEADIATAYSRKTLNNGEKLLVPIASTFAAISSIENLRPETASLATDHSTELSRGDLFEVSISNHFENVKTGALLPIRTQNTFSEDGNGVISTMLIPYVVGTELRGAIKLQRLMEGTNRFFHDRSLKKGRQIMRLMYANLEY